MRLAGICIIVLLLSSFNASPAEEAAPVKSSHEALKHLSWLIGSWGSTQGGKAVYESWQAGSSDRYQGMGFSVNGRDTTIWERLTIAATDSGTYYISDVAHNPAPVYFKLTHQDSTTSIFENPKHDFPTRITYRQQTVDSLYARIEGLRKGKAAVIDFVFGHIK